MGDDVQRNAWIDPIICTGCGTCAAHCPSGAITPGCSTDAQFDRAINTMFSEKAKSSDLLSVIVFTCNWHPYAGLEAAGQGHLPYSTAIHPLRMTCLGRVNPGIILKAFESGADGVLLLACPPGECHYEFGNRHAEDLFVEAKGLIKLLGYRDEQLGFDYVAAGDGEEFINVVRKFLNGLNGNRDL
jgi:coenzyme F420-reducing hydrogenase delta subunit